MNALLLCGRGAIDAGLRQSAAEVIQVGDRRWQFALQTGARSPVSVSAGDSFLQFDAPVLVACELAQSPQWLRWNTTLAGNAKFALVPSPWRLRLRAELPLVDDANTSARIGEIEHGLSCACQLLEGTHPSTDDFRSDAPTPMAADSGATSHGLLALLRETGWSFQERADGAAAVDFAMRGENCRMLLEENTTGLRAAVEFLRVDSPAAKSSLAIAVLLLSASGTLRLARPFAVDAEDEFTCGFEVRFAGETTAGELEHALEALAVACWACKEEVYSLLDNSAAEKFMAIRNLPPTFEPEEF